MCLQDDQETSEEFLSQLGDHPQEKQTCPSNSTSNTSNVLAPRANFLEDLENSSVVLVLP